MKNSHLTRWIMQIARAIFNKFRSFEFDAIQELLSSLTQYARYQTINKYITMFFNVDDMVFSLFLCVPLISEISLFHEYGS